MNTYLRNAMCVALSLLFIVASIAMTGSAYACSVADPNSMGCPNSEKFNTFSCRCEKKDMSEEALMCKLSVQNLETFLAQQSKACRADDDCEGHYYLLGPDAVRAVVLPKITATESFRLQLLELQTSASNVCEEEWAHLPAEPSPFEAACRNDVCVDLLAQ